MSALRARTVLGFPGAPRTHPGNLADSQRNGKGFIRGYSLMFSNALIYWFRNDLRLCDNASLLLACASAESRRLLPVYCHDPAEDAATRWGFVRRGPHRRAFLAAGLADLDAQVRDRDFKLVPVGNTFVYPIAGYSKKIKALSELKDGAQIAVPNDPTNLGRSLILLEKQGLLKLKEGAGLDDGEQAVTAG